MYSDHSEDDINSMWGGNGGISNSSGYTASNSVPVVCKRRRYTFNFRNQGSIPVRFRSSIDQGMLNTQEDMKEITFQGCNCSKQCWKNFMDPCAILEIYNCRNNLHSQANQSDRRKLVSTVVKCSNSSYSLLGRPACVRLIIKLLMISRNLFYGVQLRLKYDLPISRVILYGNRRGVDKEDIICGWLYALAETHDPQPDREYWILAHKRKRHVYTEYCEDVIRGNVPPVSLPYFLRVWKLNVGSKIVIRKCMRFAVCDTCNRIQRRREQTTDRNTLLQLLVEERNHLKFIKAERIEYAKRIVEAKQRMGDVLSIAADGADQGLYGLPYYCQVQLAVFLWCVMMRCVVLCMV